MIRTTRLRRTTLQLRHNFFTEARTFILLTPKNQSVIAVDLSRHRSSSLSLTNSHIDATLDALAPAP